MKKEMKFIFKAYNINKIEKNHRCLPPKSFNLETYTENKLLNIKTN